MKKVLLTFMAVGALQLGAQELPMPSPSAKLEQRVGLTDFTIEYSRPGVKDREIFGELVPYDQVWRTGANQNTTVSFNSPVMIGGEELEPGTYGLLTIPSPEHWVIIFTGETDMGGTSRYSEDHDVLRVEAIAEEATFTETFTIDINDIRTESANLVLEWANVKVKVPMKMRVHQQAEENIAKALEEGADNKAQVYRNAANYYYNNNLGNEQALEYITESISGDEANWYSYWLKAQIHADMGDRDAAVEAARNSINVGTKNAEKNDTEFAYTEMIEKKIESWKKGGGSAKGKRKS